MTNHHKLKVYSGIELDDGIQYVHSDKDEVVKFLYIKKLAREKIGILNPIVQALEVTITGEPGSKAEHFGGLLRAG